MHDIWRQIINNLWRQINWFVNCEPGPKLFSVQQFYCINFCTCQRVLVVSSNNPNISWAITSYNTHKLCRPLWIIMFVSFLQHHSIWDKYRMTTIFYIYTMVIACLQKHVGISPAWRTPNQISRISHSTAHTSCSDPTRNWLLLSATVLVALSIIRQVSTDGSVFSKKKK